MAIVTAGAAFALDFRQIDVVGLLEGTVVSRGSDRLILSYGGGDRDEFYGTGFVFNQFGEPTAGTITGYKAYVANELAVEITGASASAVTFMSFVKNADNSGAVFFVLSGNDQITGSAFADYLAGGTGNDFIVGFGGDDYLIGNSGQDTIDGGNGTDTASFQTAYANVTVTKTSTGWMIGDRVTGFGTDTLINVESLALSDRTLNLTLSNTTVATYETNILRTSFSELGMLVGNGAMSTSAALADLIVDARQTTSVATLAYQFFTGKIPGLGGIDYLVSPTGPNGNNLNSAYYQSFNLENRYINFAVNLGREGEGKDRFLAEYGSLSLVEATKKAYGVIFGTTPTDAKVAALLAGGRDLYFASYGGDGANGQGTKAAMVGWLLSEAVKADIGMYAKANAAFLTDLSDGATFAVDLVGVYGRPEFNFGG